MPKTHFIVISSENKTDLSYVKTKINIKTYIPKNIDTSNNCYKFQNNIFGKNNLSDNIFKNRVIFSTKLNNNNKSPITLLTQQNLFHNIKFIHKNNDFTKPRLLFTKYNITNNIINNNQYLFTPNDKSDSTNSNNDEINLSNINLNNNDITNTLGISNANNIIGINQDNITKNLCYFYNIYKPYNNSDYYNFKFSDFIDISSFINVKDISFVNIKNITVKNDFSSNNLINYDISNFTTLFKIDSSYSTQQLNLNQNYDISNNILLYNKLNNISTIKLDLIENSNYTNGRPINFIVNKTYDNYSKNYGKIYLTKELIYLNTRVLDYNSNFYTNNSYYKDATDSSKIYLSFGKSITGITQKNLFTNIKLDISFFETNTVTSNSKKSTGISKIYFTNAINSGNVNNTNYLLEENYNYDYTNILYNNIQESNIKFIDLNLNDFNYTAANISQNIYNYRFNSLKLLNNKSDFNYINSNNQFFIEDPTKDISFSNLINLKLNSLSNTNAINNNLLNYDFRFNYGLTFDVNIFLNLNYNYISENTDFSFSILKDYSSNLLLNFHKITLANKFFVTSKSDFTNVDCVFIYYDPYSDKTPDKFKYPNNNIDICRNSNIDTLSRAIELLPGASTSITNTTFIPAKNGSNLSRKMIQGLIGFNNIPSLLSIEPYDENFIVGRGFLNQYQIEEECKTNTQKIENKFNSQKHSSVKNPLSNNLNLNKVPRAKNFANIVKNRKLNQNLSNAQNCRTDLSNIKNYTTPFTNPLWRRR